MWSPHLSNRGDLSAAEQRVALMIRLRTVPTTHGRRQRGGAARRLTAYYRQITPIPDASLLLHAGAQ